MEFRSSFQVPTICCRCPARCQVMIMNINYLISKYFIYIIIWISLKFKVFFLLNQSVLLFFYVTIIHIYFVACVCICWTFHIFRSHMWFAQVRSKFWLFCLSSVCCIKAVWAFFVCSTISSLVIYAFIWNLFLQFSYNFKKMFFLWQCRWASIRISPMFYVSHCFIFYLQARCFSFWYYFFFTHVKV